MPYSPLKEDRDLLTLVSAAGVDFGPERAREVRPLGSWRCGIGEVSSSVAQASISFCQRCGGLGIERTFRIADSAIFMNAEEACSALELSRLLLILRK